MPKDHMRKHFENRSGGQKPAAVDLNFRQQATKAHLGPVGDDACSLGERDYMEDLFWLRHDLGFDADTYWNR